MSNCTSNLPYVVSGDCHGLLSGWAKTRGLRIPPAQFFSDLGQERCETISRLFHFQCVYLDEEELSGGVLRLISNSAVPVIALDHCYTGGSGISLQVSRLCDPETLQSAAHIGSRISEPVQSQLDRVSSEIASVEAQLVDDVIYSGKDLANQIIPSLSKRGVKVVRIVAGVVIGDGRSKIHEYYPEIDIMAVRDFPKVHDEICERDFLAGVPQSGRLLGKNGLPIYPKTGVPYFHPFAIDWTTGTSLMSDWAGMNCEENPDEIRDFSIFCLRQSIGLWLKVEALSGRLVHCDELERRPRGVPNDHTRFIDHLEDIREKL